MYWNFNAYKTFENTRKVTISIELLVEIFKAQTLAMVIHCTKIFVPLNFGRE